MITLDDIIAADSSRAADSSQQKSKVSALDEIIAKDSGNYTQDVAVTKPQQDDSLYGQIARQVGLTGRAAVNGGLGLPLMIGDALNSGLNYIPGVHLQLPSQAANRLMDKAGVPQPQNATERVVQDAASAMAGSGGFIKAGKALANLPSPVLQGAGNTMQSLPGMQIIGAAGSGAGGSVAHENDAGVLGQLGAGALGGGLGVLASSGITAGPRLLNSTISNLSGAVQPWTNPTAYVGKGIAAKIGADAPIVADRIRNAAEYVPGSSPTTAQAGGGATLVATEKAAANMYPDIKTQLAERGAENNNARWLALNDVARSPEELQAAIASRKELSEPAYKAAHANTANVGPAFMKYANIPEMQEAMNRANNIASLDSAVGRGVQPIWPSPNSKAINGAALDYTSRALGDMVDEAKRAGSNTKAGSLAVLKNNVDDWMGRYIPGVADARNDYAALSSPINTMEAAQQIQGSLGNKALDVNGLPNIQLPAYKSALTSAFKKQEFGIDPDALKQLQGVGQDLQRATTSNAITSPGSDSAYNLAANGWLARQLYGNEFGGATTLGKGLGAGVAVLSGHPMVGLGILGGASKLGTMAGNNLQKSLGGLLLNPNELLPYLDAASKQAPQPLPLAFRSDINQGLLGAFAAERARP